MNSLNTMCWDSVKSVDPTPGNAQSPNTVLITQSITILSGVGIIVVQHVKAAMKSFRPFSNRMMLVRFHGMLINLTIMQIYAPTAVKDETTIEQFYVQLEELID